MDEMKIRGINYNLGYGGNVTPFSYSEKLEHIKFISEMLNANYIGLIGSEPKEIIGAAAAALELGLNVWLRPRFINKKIDGAVGSVRSLAKRAEVLRKRFANLDLSFAVANELSIDGSGIFAGADYGERASAMSSNFDDPRIPLIGYWGVTAEEQRALNLGIIKLRDAAREFFHGRITYSAGIWESIRWSGFDVKSYNLYISRFTNQWRHLQLLRWLAGSYMPLVVTEIGTASCDNGIDYGADAWKELSKGSAPRYNELEQANGVAAQLANIKAASLPGCFVWTFMENDARGFGIVRERSGRLVPKKAFYTVRDFYGHESVSA